MAVAASLPEAADTALLAPLEELFAQLPTVSKCLGMILGTVGCMGANRLGQQCGVLSSQLNCLRGFRAGCNWFAGASRALKEPV